MLRVDSVDPVNDQGQPKKSPLKTQKKPISCKANKAVYETFEKVDDSTFIFYA